MQMPSSFSHDNQVQAPRLIWTLVLFLTVASVAIFFFLFTIYAPREGAAGFSIMLALGLSLTVLLFVGVVMMHNYHVGIQRHLQQVANRALGQAQIEEEANSIIMRLNELVTEQANNESNLNQELRVLFLETVRAMVATLEARDEHTQNHSLRVAYWSVMLGKALGLTEDELEVMERAALLHDIGKLSVPDSILLKPGKLTPEEFEVVKKHPSRGEEIARSIKLLNPTYPIIRHHHERPDGTGYPDGMTDLPLMIKIIAVVDCFDAMTSDRPYREAMDYRTARSTMQEVAGRQLDPDVVNKLFEILETTPEGYKTLMHITGVPPVEFKGEGDTHLNEGNGRHEYQQVS
jgi:putative nucleotidyltransferase with HDIG domain